MTTTGFFLREHHELTLFSAKKGSFPRVLGRIDALAVEYSMKILNQVELFFKMFPIQGSTQSGHSRIGKVGRMY